MLRFFVLCFCFCFPSARNNSYVRPFLVCLPMIANTMKNTTAKKQTELDTLSPKNTKNKNNVCAHSFCLCMGSRQPCYLEMTSTITSFVLFDTQTRQEFMEETGLYSEVVCFLFFFCSSFAYSALVFSDDQRNVEDEEQSNTEKEHEESTTNDKVGQCGQVSEPPNLTKRKRCHTIEGHLSTSFFSFPVDLFSFRCTKGG